MVYLDNAATTYPKPICVSDEISKCIRKYCGNPGRSSHYYAMKSAEKVYEARELLAEFFDSEPENVVFTLNTTYALNVAIKSSIKYSSHVLISDIEHNSVLRPIHELAEQKLCTYDIFSTSGSEDDIIKGIEILIKKETTMLICNHVSNVCARRLPIEKIGALCKEKGIYFIVDGAQSAGIYDIKVKSMNIDALCIPAHKGLYGPQGLGVIVFNSNTTKRSVIQGGTGISSLEYNMPELLPERLEAGTLPTPAIAGLCASLNWLKTIDKSQLRAHEEDLYRYTIERLKNINPIILYLDENHVGNTILFNVSNFGPSQVSKLLENEGICVRGGLHCSALAHKTLGTDKTGAVRVSFSIFNTRADVNTFTEAIYNISKMKK